MPKETSFLPSETFILPSKMFAASGTTTATISCASKLKERETAHLLHLLTLPQKHFGAGRGGGGSKFMVIPKTSEENFPEASFKETRRNVLKLITILHRKINEGNAKFPSENQSEHIHDALRTVTRCKKAASSLEQTSRRDARLPNRSIRFAFSARSHRENCWFLSTVWQVQRENDWKPRIIIVFWGELRAFSPISTE